MDMKIYADASCGFFICSHILEHVVDDLQALRELFRILKHGGKGILMVPIMLTLKEIDEDASLLPCEERWRRFGQDDHLRLYSKNGFLSRILNAGFTVRQLGSDYFGKDIFSKCGLTVSSVLYIVEKPLLKALQVSKTQTEFMSSSKNFIVAGENSIRNSRIPCVVTVYYDFEVILKSMEFLLRHTGAIEFFIVENWSENTNKLIKPYMLSLINTGKISKYYLFKENITNNAVEIILQWGYPF
jgi:hypothetical protein